LNCGQRVTLGLAEVAEELVCVLDAKAKGVEIEAGEALQIPGIALWLERLPIAPVCLQV